MIVGYVPLCPPGAPSLLCRRWRQGGRERRGPLLAPAGDCGAAAVPLLGQVMLCRQAPQSGHGGGVGEVSKEGSIGASERILFQSGAGVMAAARAGEDWLQLARS